MSGMLAELAWELQPKPKHLTRRDSESALRWSGYEMREGVEDFLQRHPELRSFLHEAGEKLREVFDATSDLAVEYFVDPESPVGAAKLFLLVKTPLDVEAAQARLDRFDEEWWLDNAGRGDHLVQVSTEFV